MITSTKEIILASMFLFAFWATPAQAQNDGSSSFEEEVKKHLEQLRIRGKVNELTLKGSGVFAANPAQISFTDNIEKGEETVQVDAVAGYQIDIGDESSSTFLLPFIEYRNKKTTTRDAPASKVEIIGPGALFNTLVQGGPIDMEISIAPQYIFDEAQGNDLFRAEGYLDPSFNVGDGITIGRFNILQNGDLWVKPDIAAIGLAGQVVEDGTSPILEKNNDFYGVGGEASLHVFMPTLPLVKNLTLGASYRYVQLFSLPINNAAKWSVSADYALNDARNFTLRFEYQDGRNAATFQDEEFWKVALGIRF